MAKKFNNFLNEMSNVDLGQAIAAHEPTRKASMELDNPEIVAEVNYRLENELSGDILSPEVGFERIRKVLDRFHCHLPAVLDIDPEGGEQIFEIQQFGRIYGPTPTSTEMTHLEDDPMFLYVFYVTSGSGTYEFYAELTDGAGIEEIMEMTSEDEEDEEEDEEDEQPARYSYGKVKYQDS